MARQLLHLQPVGLICGKRRYHSPREAALAKAELVRKQERGDHKPGPLHTYWCERCVAWHVGHDTRALEGG